MKINKELSDGIYTRYLELQVENKYKKSQIQRMVAEEFGVGLTTAWDHSIGRFKGSLEYKVFGDKPHQDKELQKYESVIEKPKEPKILVFDIETMANLGWAWQKWQTNILDFEQEWFVLCFCYKWYGEDEIHSVALPDFKEYKKDRINDYYVVKAMWELFDEADVVIAHNGDKFDVKKMYARFLYHGFPPPSPFKSVDTLKVARKYFSMVSNKLDDLGRYLGVGRKVTHTGWDLWKRCYMGDMEAWEQMVEYNTMDVKLLEEVYDKFKPYINNHPNYNLYKETANCCPNCGSEKLVTKGWIYTRVSKVQRYQCLDCNAWSQGNKFVR